jgi:hypothetical protein
MLSNSLTFAHLEQTYGPDVAQMTILQQEEPCSVVAVKIEGGASLDAVLYRWADGTERIVIGRYPFRTLRPQRNSKTFDIVKGLLMEVHRWRDPQ